ncbi:CLIP-associated protein [Vigna angularis]|uniref:CLIP-associated protein n=1 Tax=Phaseolus angularis TaxID=3914 RepID=A0A8T0KVF5_PHAAN|nr:CLIP-associated protein [Vigna angularis]
MNPRTIVSGLHAAALNSNALRWRKPMKSHAPRTRRRDEEEALGVERLPEDSSFKVSQGTLQALDYAAVRVGDHFKLQLNVFASIVVERLGNAKQPISDATRRLLLTLIEEKDKHNGKRDSMEGSHKVK